MSTTTLFSTLPGVHASLAGIFIAFFTAYAIYIFQQINSIKDEIDRLISALKPTYTFFLSFGEGSLLNSYDAYLAEVKRISRSLNVDKLLSTEDLLLKLQDIFKAITLFEATIHHLNNELGFKPKIENFNQISYQNSYDIFEKEYSTIMYFKKQYLENIISTYKPLYELTKEKIKIDIEIALNDEMHKYGAELTEEFFNEEVQRRLPFHMNQFGCDRILNLDASIQDLISFYENDYINLKKLIEKTKRIKDESKLYETSEKVFYWLFIPVLAFGIIIPFIILSKEECLNNTIFLTSIFQFLLVFFSFIPYVGFSIWGLRKLKSQMN
ncbi:hypothetical protein [Acinetobacter sp.]|uniref:hypothetical protein n=1 Tax=Acinetobacter sp. TaxID=472 RepID=UPI00248A2735|nr:hypothetical protein [Acinetobacter sp.]MDI1223020.1 hypothetical protein [Acinetobacter sp.]